MKHHWFIWVPRVMSGLYVLVFLTFSFHPFGGWQPSLMQNVTDYDKLLVVFFFLLLRFGAWKSPIRSGFMTLAICCIMTDIFKSYVDLFLFPIVSLPLIIISIFFFIAHYTNPELKDPNDSIGSKIFSKKKSK